MSLRSDADGDVLAEYVLALLRHEGSVEDVRKLCEAEVPDFLNEDPAAFVRDVFHAIQYRTYLPGAAPIAPPAQGLPYDDVPANSHQAAMPAQNGSRKRTNEDRGDLDMQEGRREYHANGFKQARRGRGGRGGRFDNTAGFPRGGPTGGFPGGATGFQAHQQQPQLGEGSSLSGGAPAFDPSSMEAFFQAFMPLQTISGYQQQGQSRNAAQSGRRQICRDYETKGYCARGNSCRFEHPTDSIFMPPLSNEEYDPANASLTFGALDGPAPTRANQSPIMRGRHGRSPQDRRQNRRGRAPFSAEGPVTDKSKTTIVVESIPEEHFSEEAVRDFFSQFGNIVEVSMQPYKHLAIVKYDNWDAANAAYRSPKAIFENRFVKVFWYKEGDPSIVPPSGGGQGTQDAGAAPGEGSHPGVQGAGEEINMEEILRKQEEAQKVFLEKQQKAQEIERQREEVERKRLELENKQREERQKLLAALAKKTGSSASSVTGEPAPKPSNQTEALRAQLAALEAEAKQLGIDPDTAMAEDNASGWTPGYRGGRGRGRGGFFPPPRGRGGFAPSAAFRGGGFRGGRGGGHAAYAAYSLDNRPKKVAVTGADFTNTNNDETLRRYLFVSFGASAPYRTYSLTNKLNRVLASLLISMRLLRRHISRSRTAKRLRSFTMAWPTSKWKASRASSRWPGSATMAAYLPQHRQPTELGVTRLQRQSPLMLMAVKSN